MISRDDVAKLADLSHMAVADTELEKLAGEMDSILGYISEIDKLTAEEPQEREKATPHNVMRSDTVTNEPGSYSERLLNEMPERDGDHLRVRKIL